MIDVFVLFVLHSITAHRKAVEKMFASKIKAGCFSEDLMNSVFGSHPGVSWEVLTTVLSVSVSSCVQALREFFPSILRLCESLFHSSSPTVSLFAASLYQHLFTSFLDQYCRQVSLSSPFLLSASSHHLFPISPSSTPPPHVIVAMVTVSVARMWWMLW